MRREKLAMSEFSDYFKKRRMELGYTARKFAMAKGYDVGYVSRLENGIVLPPDNKEKVEALAVALELKAETSEWVKFFDLVALARNEVPEDLRDNEMILKVLPAFYRSARTDNLSNEEIDKLIQLIEEARKTN